MLGENDNFTGSAGSDSIAGLGGNDTISALEGNNSLDGGSGNDTLDAGSGNDFLNGGDGNDALAGGGGDDTYVVDSLGDVVTEHAGGGNDEVRTSVSYTLAANVERLTLQGQGFGIDGTGNALDNVITGDSFNNVLDGGLGADTLIGGAGDDVYVIDSATDTLTEFAGQGSDTIRSSVTFSLLSLANVENIELTGAADLTATGDGLDNVLTGNDGNSTLDGGGGNDTLIGVGAETLVGGAGNDVFVYDGQQNIVELIAGGSDTVRSSITVSLTSFAFVENVELTGSADIDAQGDGAANILAGNSGVNTLSGGDGDDTLRGGAGDTLLGGAGDDTYELSGAAAVVEGANGGLDAVLTNAASYTLEAEIEVLVLTSTGAVSGIGNALNNYISALNASSWNLQGGDGDDLLAGGVGTGTMTGGLGNDLYILSSFSTIVEAGGGGLDTVHSASNYALAAELENLTLTGTALNGIGNGLDNMIIGNAEWNMLSGGAGSDTLDGGGGNDTLIGGAGDDIYIVDGLDTVDETFGGGIDTVLFGIAGQVPVGQAIGYTLGLDIENLVLTGTANIDGTGNSLVNVITGNSGSNRLSGAGGADTLSGGEGSDVYLVSHSGTVIIEFAGGGTVDQVQSSVSYVLAENVEVLSLTGFASLNGKGSAGNNLIVGNDGSNVLSGLDGNDNLQGGEGADTLLGGTGDDRLTGGAGADTLIGGIGNDSYSIDVLDLYQESAGEGSDSITVGFSFVLPEYFESLSLAIGLGNFDLTGNAADNFITGNGGNNVLDGGGGADTLQGFEGNDTYVIDALDTINSSIFDDGIDTVVAGFSYTLGANLEILVLSGTGDINGTGNAAANVITGNAGNNRLAGRGGNDTLDGAGGSDTADYSAAGNAVQADLVAGTAQDGQGGVDTLISIENLVGTQFHGDILLGDDAANRLVGGAGDDTLDGRGGSDTADYSAAGNAVQVNLSAGTAQDGQSGTDTLIGIENAVGGSGDDTLTGDAGANLLDGGAGADLLIGGRGDDVYVVDNVGDVIHEGMQQHFSIDLGSADAAGAEGNGASAGPALTADGRYLVFETMATSFDAGDATARLDIYLKDLLTGAIEHVSTQPYVGLANDLHSWTASVSADGRYVAFQSEAQGFMPSDLNFQIDVFVVDRQTGAIDVVSTNPDGFQGNSSSTQPALSADGRFVSFTSAATNLIASDTNFASDVFVKDLQTGTFERISTSAAGVAGNLGSYGSSISADGRYVAFLSEATNLVADDTSLRDAYVKDRQTGVVQRVSATSAGLQANGAVSEAAISADGQHVVFLSAATNLVTGDTNARVDAFVRDLATGVTTRVSTGDEGQQGNGAVSGAAISGDGRYVVFASAASNLVAGDTNGKVDIFVKDLLTGEFALISRDATGMLANDDSSAPAISADGRSISFQSAATNLFGGDTNGATDVMVVANPFYVVGDGTDTVRASVDWTLSEGLENLVLTGLSLSGTGNTLANSITGTAGDDTLDGGLLGDRLEGGGGNDTYYVDSISDAVVEGVGAGTDQVFASATVTLGANVENLALTGTSALSGTGNVLNNAITGNSGNNVLDGGGGDDTLTGGQGNDVYLVDSAGDLVVETSGQGADTVRSAVSYTLGADVEDLQLTGTANLNGTGNSLANTIAGNDGNNRLDGGLGDDTLIGGRGNDVYVVNSAGDVVLEGLQPFSIVQAHASTLSNVQWSNVGDFSADGRYFAFQAVTSDGPGMFDQVSEVFVKDLWTGELRFLSLSATGEAPNDASAAAALSADGRKLLFVSDADNLVPGDTNGQTDIFLKDTVTGELQRVSTSSAGAQADGYSARPDMSADGRYVVFDSAADNLVATATPSQSDVYLKDLQTGETRLVSASAAGAAGDVMSFNPAISADGRYAAFGSLASNLVAGDINGLADIFIKDLQTGAVRIVPGAIDGLLDYDDFHTSLSTTGRYLAFSSKASNVVGGDVNGVSDVFVLDQQTGAYRLVSADAAGAQAAGGDSKWASISGDGRYVAFQSAAANLVPGDTNGTAPGFADIFVKDLLSGAIARVSVNAGGVEANAYNLRPTISADGRFISFLSGATNLVPGDTNGRDDSFIAANPLYDPGGGNDTVEASISYALNAGFENLTLTGTGNVNGTGNGQANVLTGNSGSNVLDGAAGTDTAAYGGLYRQYLASGNPIGTAMLQGPDGTDTLLSIEKLAFVDGNLNFDPNAHVAQAARLYLATLGRQPDALGLNFWLGSLEAGVALGTMASSFVGSAEFQTRYGSLNNSQFVNQIYQNVLDRPADAGGLAFWTNALANGATRGQVVMGFSESVEFIQKTAALYQAGLWDIDETAASVARLYFGALDRAPMATELANGIASIRGGAQTLAQFANGLLSGYAALNNPDFVQQMYQSVFGRAATGGEQNGALDYLSWRTRGEFALSLTDSDAYKLASLALIDRGVAIDDTILGTLGNDTLNGTVAADTIRGFGGNDQINGGSGNDALVGGADDDALNGGAGFDIAGYAGLLRQYGVTGNAITAGGVQGPEGSDTLSGVEKLTFVDGSLNFDPVSAIAQVTRLYLATLDRLPDAGGLNFWLANIESGTALKTMATSFVNSAEFQSHYGSLSSAQFVSQIYQNVLDRPADAGGLAFWTGVLDSGVARGQVVLGFSESSEFVQKNAALYAAGLWDIDETAASVARLYLGIADRAPTVNEIVVHTAEVKAGQSTLVLEASGLVGAYSGLSNAQFVDQMYQNLYNRAATAGEQTSGTAYLSGHTRGEYALTLTESSAFVIATIGQIDHGIAASDAHFP